MKRRVGFLFCAGTFVLSAEAAALELQKIPDEYESTSGLGTGLNNAGFAANEGPAAVRANPALLPLEKEYTVSAGYHWPVSGRDYYQASVIDSKTSSLAAGVTYTGYQDDYVYPKDAGKRLEIGYDSPIVRRGVVGFGQVFGQLSIGAGGTYVEAHRIGTSEDALRLQGESSNIKGFGVNLGVASPITSQLRLGGSVENVSNRKIREYAPKTYRFGAAYQFTQSVTGYVDYRQRDRVAVIEAGPSRVDDDDFAKTKADLEKKPEQMAIASATAQLQDYLRLMGSYGQALSDDRRSLAGGVAVVNKNFSLSYTASRPYMTQSTAHQAISLSMDMAM